MALPASTKYFKLRALGKRIRQRHRPVTWALATSCTKLLRTSEVQPRYFSPTLRIFVPCLNDASRKPWDLAPQRSTSPVYDMILLRMSLTTAGGLNFPMIPTTHNGADRLPSLAKRYSNPRDGYLETFLDLKMQLIPHTIPQRMRLISALRLKITTLVSVPNLGAHSRTAKQLVWTCSRMSLDV